MFKFFFKSWKILEFHDFVNSRPGNFREKQKRAWIYPLLIKVIFHSVWSSIPIKCFRRMPILIQKARDYKRWRRIFINIPDRTKASWPILIHKHSNMIWDLFLSMSRVPNLQQQQQQTTLHAYDALKNVSPHPGKVFQFCWSLGALCKLRTLGR